MTGSLAVRQDVVLTPDPRRVILKLFVPGEDAALVRTRARALIDRVAHLDEEETGRLLRATFERFGARHRDLDGRLHHHYDLVRHRAARAWDLSPPPVSWSAPTSVTSTRSSPPRCATRRWWSTPIRPV